MTGKMERPFYLYKMTPEYQFKEITHRSPEYEQTIALRNKVLRQPIGLKFTQAQLEAEASDFHLTLWKGPDLLGCLVLTPKENGRIQMRQVAIEPDWQGKGIGRRLVEYAEQFARDKGFTTMFCHARVIAVPFYEKMDYQKVGEPFVEATIVHFEMEKKL
jgi:N-acetylglutamate synthase-like GNAT family acetyltransferase